MFVFLIFHFNFNMIWCKLDNWFGWEIASRLEDEGRVLGGHSLKLLWFVEDLKKWRNCISLRQPPVSCRNLVADLNSFTQLHEKGPATVPLVSKCKKQMGVSKKGRDQLVKFWVNKSFSISTEQIDARLENLILWWIWCW